MKYFFSPTTLLLYFTTRLKDDGVYIVEDWPAHPAAAETLSQVCVCVCVCARERERERERERARGNRERVMEGEREGEEERERGMDGWREGELVKERNVCARYIQMYQLISHGRVGQSHRYKKGEKALFVMFISFLFVMFIRASLAIFSPFLLCS